MTVIVLRYGVSTCPGSFYFVCHQEFVYHHFECEYYFVNTCTDNCLVQKLAAGTFFQEAACDLMGYFGEIKWVYYPQERVFYSDNQRYELGINLGNGYSDSDTRRRRR